MPYFSIRGGSDLPVVVVEVSDRKPKAVDRSGFQINFMVQITDDQVPGAKLVIERLDERMGKATRGKGMYQARVEEVRAHFDDIVRENALRPKHDVPTRIAAGVAAVTLGMIMIALAVPICILWLAVLAFRKESGLHAMADTAVLFSIFDWRTTIHKLGRIASGK